MNKCTHIQAVAEEEIDEAGLLLPALSATSCPHVTPPLFPTRPIGVTVVGEEVPMATQGTLDTK